ncbi:MAG TPA: glutamine--fructose-6-phosphate transaminase (isomerizing) [Candidatus Mucispirillum faecigallinarum]|uniref:Glutamine--fructose-6-phosphate aminotransferase [isomerizing] n=1 Tax=Candidatus Mucispirillum faecigallinarum TaxID=2838699 RepID=A0A9D2KB23_9BACT|nr:glutamine--fructose-6-phosphate transaminase (isomerizing) [Candidatus Mucispirillum faecigallinarum]
MCGIVGYTGRKESAPILIAGLKALEYRGYDSAGLAVEEKDGIKIVKSVGKVSALKSEVSNYTLHGTTGIAHTRWATHGKPSTINSHPHSDCLGEIAVVHNGIIENYQALKDELIKKGHTFKSETDTEVIAHLLEEKLKSVNSDYENEFLKAAAEVTKMLEGSYALGLLWKKAPNMIIGSRVKSPLVCGAGENENFLGSDVSAFNQWTRNAIYLDDYDIVVLKENEIKIYDRQLHEKYYNIIELEQGLEQSGKNGYEHYMLKEINEQPFTVRSTIEAVLKDINTAFGITKDELKNIKNILMIGCGTAYHATMVAKYWVEEFCNIPCQAEYASEYKYRKAAMPDETLAVFVSQSGETADTVSALEKARAAGFKTLSICNVFGSTLARMSDHTFYTKCGSEISVASTKAFTAQLAALFSLSVLIAESAGSISTEKKGRLLNELAKLPVAIETAVSEDGSISKLAEKYYKEKTFVFLGRNVNYPIALEGALKLKEITYLQAEGFPAGEIKHGPIALINTDMPVISIMPADSLYDKMVNACEEVMARGAKAIAVTDEKGYKLLENRVEDVIVLPNVEEYLFPFISVIALQLFAYRIAKLNNREIDQPRNLAKSVTVE